MNQYKDLNIQQQPAEVDVDLNLPPLSFYRERLAPTHTPSTASPVLKSGKAWNDKVEDALDALRKSQPLKGSYACFMGVYFSPRRNHVEH